MAKTATTEKPDSGDMDAEAQAAYDARVAAQAALNSGEEKAAPAKAKRTTLTPEQKIAKLEAELKAARDKVQAKDRKRLEEIAALQAKATAKRDEAESHLTAYAEEIAVIRGRLGEGDAG